MCGWSVGSWEGRRRWSRPDGWPRNSGGIEIETSQDELLPIRWEKTVERDGSMIYEVTNE